MHDPWLCVMLVALDWAQIEKKNRLNISSSGPLPVIFSAALHQDYPTWVLLGILPPGPPFLCISASSSCQGEPTGNGTFDHQEIFEQCSLLRDT
jgi:hypothetical protein